jgi:tetratricopeptide (TPR) repeat protein
MAAREAIRLDAKYAGGYSALADVRFLSGNFSEAEDLFRRAFALDANDPDALNRYYVMLTVEGRLKESLAIAERVRMLEPFVPTYQRNLAGAMQINGQNQASIPILESIPADAGGYYRSVYLARAYAAAGDYAKSSDTLLAISGNQVSRRSVEEAARLIRTAPTKAKAPGALPVLEGELSFVYAYVDAVDRTLDYPERGVAINFLGQSTLDPVWYPPFAPIRKTERFKALMRKAGLVDYWRAKGWPDLCHPVGADDFVCD